MRPIACAALLLASIASAQAQPLGRLFYTPQERQRLQEERRGQDSASAQQDDRAPLRLSGIVRSGHGTALAWIDGRTVADGAVRAGFVVRIEGSGVRLQRADGRVFDLPVGRALDPVSGRLIDGLDASQVSRGRR